MRGERRSQRWVWRSEAKCRPASGSHAWEEPIGYRLRLIEVNESLTNLNIQGCEMPGWEETRLFGETCDQGPLTRVHF